MQVSRVDNPHVRGNARPVASMPAEDVVEQAPGVRSEASPAAKAELPEWKAARNGWQDARATLSTEEWFALRAAWMEQRDVALGKTIPAEPEEGEPPVIEGGDASEPPILEEADGFDRPAGDQAGLPAPELSQPVDGTFDWTDLLETAPSQPLPGEDAL